MKRRLYWKEVTQAKLSSFLPIAHTWKYMSLSSRKFLFISLQKRNKYINPNQKLYLHTVCSLIQTIHFWISHCSWKDLIFILYFTFAVHTSKGPAVWGDLLALSAAPRSVCIFPWGGKQNQHCENCSDTYCRHPTDTCPRWTHISFSSWSRVDCSCKTTSWSWASISSWLVWSSSRASSSLFCFSFTFSTLVTCCSLWSSWYCCSS